MARLRPWLIIVALVVADAVIRGRPGVACQASAAGDHHFDARAIAPGVGVND